MASQDTWSQIPVRRETRDLVRTQKVGDQTYDELLREMVDQYDPEAAREKLLNDATHDL